MRFDPFTVSLLGTESDKPGLAMSALFDAFSAKQGDLQTALEATIKTAVNPKGK